MVGRKADLNVISSFHYQKKVVMRKMRTIVVIVMFFCLAASSIFANGVEVNNVQRLISPNRDYVAFELSWQNSWNVTGTPGNHDAVWVFIKYRECGQNGNWSHALLSTTEVDHTLPANLAFADSIRIADRFGVSNNHNTGAMIRRATIGTGNIAASQCTLKVVGGSGGALFDPLIDYDIRVVGIEMVFIPEGSYILGDNGNPTYKIQTSQADNSPLAVNSEGVLSFYDGACCCSNYNLPANFPKGYASFYLMKYEISQGQYADFLNTISNASAAIRYTNSYGLYRHRITVTGGQYVSERQDRACNYLSYDDLLTYLDWASLRPMTEFEYEKATKGAGILTPNGYAWGSGVFVEAFNLSGAENGTETCTDVNANLHAFSTDDDILGGDNPTVNTNLTKGPVGCGIFARDATQTRETTGATYYGVMEMSGNVWEIVITRYLTSCANFNAYTGIWGDGLISAGGAWNNPDWPTGVNSAPRPNGARGGSWDYNPNSARVADRQYCYSGNFTYNRNRGIGGRGAR